MKSAYRGKYPNRIRMVSCMKGIATVQTNAGTRYIIAASMLPQPAQMPHAGEDIMQYIKMRAAIPA